MRTTNYVTMRKATQEEIDSFVDYRANHIALVRRIGRVLFGLDLSEHDKDKIECDADDLNLYALRNAMQDGGYRPLKNDKVILNNLAGRHVKSQKHHPEYWDDAITVDSFNYEDPAVVDASKMPDRYLKELVCDWSAVAVRSSVVESRSVLRVKTRILCECEQTVHSNVCGKVAETPLLDLLLRECVRELDVLEAEERTVLNIA